jgi:hypothetical protein
LLKVALNTIEETNFPIFICWPKDTIDNILAKFGKDPIYRTSYHAETTLLSKIIFIVSDPDLWPNVPKINRVLPLLQGNHGVLWFPPPIKLTTKI